MNARELRYQCPGPARVQQGHARLIPNVLPKHLSKGATLTAYAREVLLLRGYTNQRDLPNINDEFFVRQAGQAT
jgi:hypothetical protein